MRKPSHVVLHFAQQHPLVGEPMVHKQRWLRHHLHVFRMEVALMMDICSPCYLKHEKSLIEYNNDYAHLNDECYEIQLQEESDFYVLLL